MHSINICQTNESFIQSNALGQLTWHEGKENWKGKTLETGDISEEKKTDCNNPGMRDRIGCNSENGKEETDARYIVKESTFVNSLIGGGVMVRVLKSKIIHNTFSDPNLENLA